MIESSTRVRDDGPPVDWGGVAVFIVLSFGGAWLAASPFWLGAASIASPPGMILLLLMMFTPTAATLVAARRHRHDGSLLVDTGVRPVRPVRRWAIFAIIAWLGIPILALVALAVGAVLGLYESDLGDFSALRAALATAGAELPAGVPIQAVVIGQLVSLLIAAAINIIPAFGEEWGWRGFLLHRLLPLGTWPALLLSGLAWGLWHAPIVLLGYNYPGQAGPMAVMLMTGSTVVFGVLFGWLRLASRLIWPAVIAHAALNATAGLSLIFGRAGTSVDTAQVTLLGWSGWIAPLGIIALLVVTGRSPRQAHPAPGWILSEQTVDVGVPDPRPAP